MLVFSARSGALARRIGPRIPLTVGPFVIAAGLLLMLRIAPGDSYVSSVLPAMIVFGVGLTIVVAPVTATVLAAADSRRSGIASGINNAVARVGGLLAVAVLPLVAGITGDKFYDPQAMEDGFYIAVVVCAVLSVLGGVIAGFGISSDLLTADEQRGGPAPKRYSCDVAGTPLSPERREPEPAVSRP
jgi:MFS family permease